MTIETVHLLRSSSSKSHQVYFLIIPIIIFGLILAFYLLRIRSLANSQVATIQGPSVLGEQKLSPTLPSY